MLDIHLGGFNDINENKEQKNQIIETTINGKKVRFNLLDKPVEIISKNDTTIEVRS